MNWRHLLAGIFVIAGASIGVQPLAAQTNDPTQSAVTQDLAALDLITSTRYHKPGDPINVCLVGSQDELIALMQAAGWQQAVAITLKSSAKIVGSVAFHRGYATAPVSTLFYLGHSQDLTFEKQVGRDARQRHHVRFWKVRDDGPDGRPLWLGAATFDVSVGISYRNGAVTHHISGNVDQERDFLLREMVDTGKLAKQFAFTGHGSFNARNGGGDLYQTDGNLAVGVITPGIMP